MRFRKSRWGFRAWNASWGTGRIICWGPISRWPTSTCCRGRMPSDLPSKDRVCIRNTRPSADGGRGWRHIRPCESFVPRCRRTLRSSMRGNGRFRIGPNTDGHAAAFGCNANGGSHEMDHARARQGRPGRLPMAHQEIRRRGRGVHFRSTRQGGERGQTPERHPLRREKRRIGTPRQGVLVRGDLEKIQVDRRPCARAAGQDRQRCRYRQYPLSATRSGGLKAVAEGFRHLGFKDDHAVNAAEWIVYDALYAYCREMVQQGKHNGDFAP